MVAEEKLNPKTHLINNKVLVRAKSGGMRKSREITQKQSYGFQDVATEVQRPERVALGHVVIISLHKPQRRHKDLEATDVQIKQPVALNHMRSKLHSPIQARALAQHMICELRATGLRGVLT